jgi:hypothetical protein
MEKSYIADVAFREGDPLSIFRFGNSEGVTFAILLAFNALSKPLKSQTYLIFRKVSQTRLRAGFF